MSAVDLSVVVPTYRGRDSLEPLLDRLADVLRARGLSYEVIVVNDASPDDTWDVLRKLSQTRPELRALDLLVNHGQARATLCGIAQARGQLVATMDDDLQQPPEELPKLLDALEENPDWDAVIGRWDRDEGLLRDMGSRVHAWADQVANRTPKDFRHSSFRLMRRTVAHALLHHETRTPVVGPLLRQVTWRLHNVPVEHAQRETGSSGFRFAHGVRAVSANFFQTSTLPLRALSGFGMAASLVALLVGVVFLARWVIGYQTPPGWASSFLAVVFFGGAILFGVGLLGEYTSLIMKEVRRPPRWSIRSTIGEDPFVEG